MDEVHVADLADGRLEGRFAGQHLVAALPPREPGEAETRLVILEELLDAHLPKHEAVAAQVCAPTLAKNAAALPPEGAQFAAWDGPAPLKCVPPCLRKMPLRCPPRGRNSRLGTARRRSWLPYPVDCQWANTACTLVALSAARS